MITPMFLKNRAAKKERRIKKEANELLLFYIEQVLDDTIENFNKRTVGTLYKQAQNLVETFGIKVARDIVIKTETLTPFK